MQSDALHTREDLLEAYAVGIASAGASLLVAAHLTLRPESRKAIQAVEEVGGALLSRSEASTPMSSDALDCILTRLDVDETSLETPRARATFEPSDPVLPGPIREAAGGDAHALPWRRRMRGLHEVVLDGFGDERVSLLKAQPGVRIPHHGHSGAEATLVLTGALKDGGAVMTAGDFSLCGPDDDHHPEITGDETCYCLAVVEGKLRFRSRIGQALGLC